MKYGSFNSNEWVHFKSEGECSLLGSSWRVQILLTEEKVQLVPPTSRVSDLTSGCGQEGKRKIYFSPHIFCQCFIAAREGYMNCQEPAHETASKPRAGRRILNLPLSSCCGASVWFQHWESLHGKTTSTAWSQWHLNRTADNLDAESSH